MKEIIKTSQEILFNIYLSIPAPIIALIAYYWVAGSLLIITYDNMKCYTDKSHVPYKSRIILIAHVLLLIITFICHQLVQKRVYG